ncbi:Epididymal secretory protein E1 [Exaiptasia diaphana]|nr:Epididymal secretory protein E1 [Exaiptasia diaphana]
MKPAISLALVVIIAAVTSIQAMKLKFKDCGSQVGEIVSLDVTPCTSDPCSLKRGGTNATVTINFKPHEQVTQSKIYVYAIIGIIPIPLPIPNPDACTGHGLTCPLASGKDVELVVKQSIDSTFPAGKVTVKAELKDQVQNNVLCGEVTLTLM